MNPLLVAWLERCRNLYDFPWARICTVPLVAGEMPVTLAPGLDRYFHTRPGHITDRALDAFHGDLLRSSSPADVRDGCASAIYWGFITRNEPFARLSATRFYHRNSAVAVVAGVCNSASECLASRWGVALGSLGGLLGLGRMPFASKVITFLDPANAGVYDNRINKFLLDHPRLCSAIMNPVGPAPVDANGRMTEPVTAPATWQRYQIWCRRLQQARDDLNTHVAPSSWKCTESLPQQWRAVDVERAIFRLAALLGTPPVPDDDEQLPFDVEPPDGHLEDLPMTVDRAQIEDLIEDFFGNQPSVD
jgi:hypothetical protein